MNSPKAQIKVVKMTTSQITDDNILHPFKQKEAISKVKI
jgi:hypothetical protein